MLIDPQPDCRTLVLTGEGVEPLLHGQTTCEVRQLSNHQGTIGALCNPKGRMLSQFLLHRQDDVWYLTMHASLFDSTLARLKKYGVFYKVDFTEYQDTHHDLYTLTPEADGLTSGLQWQVVAYANGWAMQIDQAGHLWRLFAHQPSSAEQSNLDGAWLQAGITMLTAEEVDTYLPQAFGLEQIGGIDFKKGCYTGQEIVARVHYKGKVKQQLARFTSSQTVTLGSDIRDQHGKSLGKVLRSAPLQDQHWVLGLLAETDDSTLFADTATLTALATRFS